MQSMQINIGIAIPMLGSNGEELISQLPGGIAWKFDFFKRLPIQQSIDA